MRVTPRGQVTIPVDIRRKAGLVPNVEVEVTLDANEVRIRRAGARHRAGRGAAAVSRLRGRATTGMSTAEILGLTRHS